MRLAPTLSQRLPGGRARVPLSVRGGAPDKGWGRLATQPLPAQLRLGRCSGSLRVLAFRLGLCGGGLRSPPSPGPGA